MWDRSKFNRPAGRVFMELSAWATSAPAWIDVDDVVAVEELEGRTRLRFRHSDVEISVREKPAAVLALMGVAVAAVDVAAGRG